MQSRSVSAFFAITVAIFAGALPSFAQNDAPITRTNRAERLEWFRDQGFGLFIHWSVDSQLGSVISHSLVGASDDYVKRFVAELPETFNPRKFHPSDWAALAKLAGIRYVVFTAKHHSGFCMWDTATTDFSIAHTPFQRDITAELLQAFRAQGIAPGLYFSPDDFWWLHQNGVTIQRGTAAVQPRSNPGLMAHDQAQVRELLTKYGPIDVMFFDGEAQGLRDLAWQLQPDLVVTRGAIQTPEQYVPGVPLEGAWEACLTMGTQWQYKPTNEDYKTGWDCLSLLIETRAKGGNLLLNVGPKPDGELPIEQEQRLREIALWMFVNGECIYGVRPWIITNEKDIWFTRKKNQDTLYAIVKLRPEARWKHGEWKEIVLHSVRATDQTQVRVMGQNDQVLEYLGRRETVDHLDAGNGRPARPGHARPANLQRPEVAQSRRAQTHARQSSPRAAACRYGPGELGQVRPHRTLRRRPAKPGRRHVAGNRLRVSRHHRP